MSEDEWVPIAPRLANGPVKPYLDTAAAEKMYRQSIDNGETFWGDFARDNLSWSKPFTKVMSGSFSSADVKWFQDGELNACYNCVDRWAEQDPDRVAIIYEPDDPNDQNKFITYGQLKDQTSRIANILKDHGVQKGDVVGVYMPMIPEALVAVLAITRIGAIHSVVFAGFSRESLVDRLGNAECKVILASNVSYRGGKTINLKSIIDEALNTPDVHVKSVILYNRKRDGDKTETSFYPNRDYDWDDLLSKASPECPPTPVNAEDPMFILYTSGSTGTPKGVVHTTGGYLTGAFATFKYIFDVHPGDRFGCTADIGWITGHTYLVYGPLLNGVATLVFESTPMYPTPSRFWDVVDKYKLTQFYTAPTALRLLMKAGSQYTENHSFESLRTLGSVGEPINEAAWKWYDQYIGRHQCAIVDTYWQTETGSIVISPLPGATKGKIGSATNPFFGIEPVLLDAQSGEVLQGNDVTGVLCFQRPWPSVARTVFKDHDRYKQAYLSQYNGYFFTGDGAHRDKDGYYWIRGRVDDVINVSGHRLSTSEIETCLSHYPAVADSAAVGVPDDITGQAIIAFVSVRDTHVDATVESLIHHLKMQIRSSIGAFASPKRILVVSDLPKTRSGKIMRRILRKIGSNEVDSIGDVTTLANPGCVEEIIQQFNQK